MVRWTQRAASDLIAIGAFIDRDNQAAARQWVERLRERATLAAEMPRAGRVVPELGRDDVREVFLRTYRIVYRIDGEGIVVLAVVEGHRLLAPLDPNANGR